MDRSGGEGGFGSGGAQRQAMATVRIPEQKVILCGEYGVGKSSIFRRFATNSFVTATDRQSTLGLDHYDRSFAVGDKAIKVRGRGLRASLRRAATPFCIDVLQSG